jgi:hypothetical protein
VTVYVDDARITARVGRTAGNWSHLFAGPWDDVAELHALAAAIGLRRAWYQDHRWPHGHYDVVEPRRQAAIAAGAVPVTWRETGRMMAEARDRGPGNPPAEACACDAARPVITAESPSVGVSCAQLPAGRIRALTLRQPWATAVAELGKNVENRTWRLPPGYLWIHAGARSGWDPAGPAHPAFAAAWRGRRGDVAAGPGLVTFSSVVALVRVTGAHHAADCTSDDGRRCSPWAAGDQVHNTLELAAVLPEPVRADGQQKLWALPVSAESACRVQLAA